MLLSASNDVPQLIAQSFSLGVVGLIVMANINRRWK
jgi:hypothetical protein